MNTEDSNRNEDPEKERTTLSEKLSAALQENKSLHERLADLDIAMSIETTELRKEIETLLSEKSDLLKENEFLLEDYTAKDHRIQNLLREVEIKQNMMKETSHYLTSATERIKNLEKKCSSLEAQYAGIYGDEPVSEKLQDSEAAGAESPGLTHPLISEIRKEFEGVLGQKDIEIETLSRNMEQLKQQNLSLASEKAEIEKEISGQREKPDTLEGSLLEMEHSLTELEQRISKASEIGVKEKEEILVKLDDAQREIFSLREYHRSLLEALRKTDEDASKGILSLSDYQKSLLSALRQSEAENELLRTELNRSVQDKDDEIIALRLKLEELISRSSELEARLEAESENALQDGISTAAEKVNLEDALREASSQIAQLAALLQSRDTRIKDMEKRLEEGAAEADRTKAEAEVQLKASAETLTALEAENRTLQDQIAVLSAQTEEYRTKAEKYSDLEAVAEASQERMQRLETEKAETEEAFRNSCAQVSQLTSSLAQKELMLSDLGTAREAQKAEGAQAAAQAAAGAARKIEELESSFKQEAARAEGLQDALARKELVLQELHQHFLEDSEGLRKESERLQQELEKAAEESRRLRDEIAVCADQNAGVREKLTSADKLSAELEELTLKLGTAQEVLQSREAEIAGLTEELAACRGTIGADQPAGTAEADRLRIGELLQENSILSDRLREAIGRADGFAEMKSTVSGEILRLSEQIQKLKEESMSDRVSLKNDIGDTLSIMAESAEKLDHAISESIPLAKKLEEISEGLRRENLPALAPQSAAQAPPEEQKSTKRPLAYALALLCLLMVLAGYVYRNELLLLAGATGRASSEAGWASGVKAVTLEEYEINVTFMNKESVHVLGYSDLISEQLLVANHVMLLSVRNTRGCIPEGFVTAPEKYLSFVDKNGSQSAVRASADFSREKKTVLKKNACNGKPGTIYLKHIIASPRLQGVTGLRISGLQKDSADVR